MIRYSWIALLIFIPVIPKDKAFNIGAVPVLWDDLCLLIAVGIGIGSMLIRAAALGVWHLSLFRVSLVFAYLFLFKAISFSLLASIYPWIDFSGIGRGVMFTEGLLVLAKTAVFLSIFILLTNTLKSISEIDGILRVYIAAIVIVVLVGIGQFFILGHPILTSTFRPIYTLSLVTASWGVENPWLDNSASGHEHLGAYLILAVSLLGGVLLHRGWEKKKIRYGAILLFGGCVFVLLFASSRGAWIGAMFSLLAFFFFAFKQRNLSNLLVISGGVCIALVLLELILGVEVVEYVYSRTHGLFGILYGEIQDDSAYHRLNTLGRLWGAFTNSILIGWGPGGAGRIAEGQFIRELVEGGIIGFSIFIALVFVNGLVALRAYRLSANARFKGIYLGFFCGLVGICGQSLFTELFVITKVAVPFWILSAIVHRMSSIELKQI